MPWIFCGIILSDPIASHFPLADYVVYYRHTPIHRLVSTLRALYTQITTYFLLWR